MSYRRLKFLTRTTEEKKERRKVEEKRFSVFDLERFWAATLAILQHVLIIAIALAVLKNTW